LYPPQRPKRKLAAVRTKAEDSEVVVQGGRALYPEPPHHHETGSVDNREILVALGQPDLPRGLQVRGAHALD
jgi:hypothetical protein